MKIRLSYFLLILGFVVFYACSDDPISSGPTPYQLEIPGALKLNFPPPVIPADNPLTEEGVALGRKLFFDPILSADGTQACANCHLPSSGFTDNRQFSPGIDGIVGNRNSMPLFNAAWNFGERFFWDGRSRGLEEQALEPVTNPIEMHNTWVNAMSSLQAHPDYPELFNQAFGTSIIDSSLVTKAIAQFERTLISGNSKFDRYLLDEINLSPAEFRGLNVFMAEEGGDCFHCHGNPANPLWTDNDFHNNGLDSFFTDKGLENVTGNPFDRGKFKTPSLRNLVFTAPYMHDGRFATIDEVLEHYSTGVKVTTTTDPLMQFSFQGGVQMTPEEKSDLKAFLLTLTDSSFITNPAFQAP
ncbi:MAG: cytochrome c peroxidase [Chitinophagales bacterium]